MTANGVNAAVGTLAESSERHLLPKLHGYQYITGFEVSFTSLFDDLYEANFLASHIIETIR